MAEEQRCSFTRDQLIGALTRLEAYPATAGPGQRAFIMAESMADALIEALGPAEVVTEHAQLMSGGGYDVWNTEPYIEEIYPLAKRIEAGQRFGGKVYRRKIIVVQDWRLVPKRRRRQESA